MNMANESYKRHLFVPRSAVSSDVRSLLNETSYPLKFEEEGGAVVSQFEKGAMQGVASFMARGGPRAHEYKSDAYLHSYSHSYSHS